MSDDRNNAVHNLIMEQCKKLNITGVNEVKSFDEETAVLDTSAGQLTVKGENLIMGDFSATTGEFSMEGKVWGIVYSDAEPSRGLLKRLLK